MEHLKDNMNDYLGRDKTEKEKESIIKTLNREKVSAKEIQQKRLQEIIEKIQKKLIYKVE